MKLQRDREEDGLTLIELLVVVAIIAVLVALLLPVLALCLLVPSGHTRRETYDRDVALQKQADELAAQIQEMDRRIADVRALLANLEYVQKGNRKHLDQLKDPR